MDIPTITKLFKTNPSKFCFLLYDVLTEPYECEIKGLNFNPLTFAFRYRHIYIFEGNDSLKYIKSLQKPDGEVNLVYCSILREKIPKYFTNLSISDPSGEGDTNHFLTMQMTQNTFRPFKTSISNHPIRFGKNEEISLNVPLANKSLLLNPDNVSFVIKIDENIASVAIAPNIYKGNEVEPFAILRGIWTDKRYRNKGLASNCISNLCNELFYKYNIQNLFIWVEKNNPVAYKIYSRLGFSTKGKWFANKACFINRE